MSSTIKRVKLSGGAYRRQREESKEENQLSARTIHNFLMLVAVPVPDIVFVEALRLIPILMTLYLAQSETQLG